jgi:serine/threonine-protein kinase
MRDDGLQRWLRVSGGDRPRVQKVLDPSLSALVPAWLSRVNQNRTLTHAACSRVVEIDPQSARFTSDFADGVMLVDVAKRALTPTIAVYVLSTVLDALAHAGDLLHLDLDPAGVLVRRDGSLLLPEFGLWSVLSPEELARRRFDANRVAYTSPEIVRARALDARSDVFSAGWLAYELLTQRTPFAGASALAIATAVDRGERAPLSSFRVDASLCDVIEVMLQTEPDARFQSAGAARSALLAVTGVDLARAQAELAARVQPSAEPRTRIGLGLAALLRASDTKKSMRIVQPRSLTENPFVANGPPINEAVPEPPPLFLPSSAGSRPRAPRTNTEQGAPVHDGRTAFLKVETALRTVLPKAWKQAFTPPRAPASVPGKWREPDSGLFRVRSAVLAGPVVRVARWPRAALALAAVFVLSGLSCVYLLCRLWF